MAEVSCFCRTDCVIIARDERDRHFERSLAAARIATLKATQSHLYDGTSDEIIGWDEFEASTFAVLEAAQNLVTTTNTQATSSSISNQKHMKRRNNKLHKKRHKKSHV